MILHRTLDKLICITALGFIALIWQRAYTHHGMVYPLYIDIEPRFVT